MSPRIWLAIPAVLALLVHAPSVGHGFVGDDAYLLVGNPQITEASSARAILLTDWFDRGRGDGIGYYRPVVKASFIVTWWLFGQQPAPFHATNVLAHALAVLALTLLAARLCGARAAVLGASIFAVHPSTVEAIDIITARSDVFAGLFALSALVLFARWLELGRWPWLVAALVSSVLALGSKESAVLLPLAVIALALARGEVTARAIRSAFPVVWAFGLFLGLRLLVSGVSPAPNGLALAPWWLRGAAVVKVVGAYIGPVLLARPILFLPRLPASPLDPTLWAGLFALAAAGGALIKGRARTPEAFAVVLGAAGLAPALAIWLIHVPAWKDELPMAERWLYLPCAALGLLAASLLGRVRPRLGLAIGLALIMALGLTTLMRTPAYASPEASMAFFVEEARAREFATLSPIDRQLLHLYRAYLLKRDGELEAARVEALAAIDVAPWLPDGWKQLADIELKLGKAAECEAALVWLLSKDFQTRPEANAQRAEFNNDTLARMDRAQLFTLLGRALALQGKQAQAERAFADSERIRASGAVFH